MSHLTLQRRARLRTGFVPQVAAAARPAPLEITEIRLFPVREPVSGSGFSLLKVTTPSGVTAWSESGYDPNSDVKALQSN